jgi:hypothetical protein
MTSPARPAFSTRYKLTITALIASAAVLIGIAVWATDTENEDEVAVSGGGEAPSGGPVVEQTTPRDGSEALSQTQIGIDLAPGYDGRLVVNSVEVPDEDVDKDTNLNQIVFVPSEGKAVEELPSGQETCVLALYWPLAEGEGGAGSGSYRWCFDVT